MKSIQKSEPSLSLSNIGVNKNEEDFDLRNGFLANLTPCVIMCHV